MVLVLPSQPFKTLDLCHRYPEVGAKLVPPNHLAMCTIVPRTSGENMARQGTTSGTKVVPLV